MQRTILKAQLERELEARNVASSSEARIVLSDRSAIDPIAYAILTATNEKDERQRKQYLVDSPEFQTALRWYQEGMFILFKPVPEWLVDDGVRSMDERGQNLDVFRGILRELKIPFVELGEEIKDLQSRVAFAKRLMVRMLILLGLSRIYHGSSSSLEMILIVFGFIRSSTTRIFLFFGLVQTEIWGRMEEVKNHGI